MRSVKVIIIGGVAGGASAAARLRRLDEKAEIIMLERSGYISYANCGLPYYIGGVIREKGALSVQTPESFGGRFRIDVRVRNEAVSIDPKEKTVWVRNLETGEEYTETYDKLLLSPGAKAIRPALPGMEDARIMTLRTVDDPGVSGRKEAEAGGRCGRRLHRAGSRRESDGRGTGGFSDSDGGSGAAAAGL